MPAKTTLSSRLGPYRTQEEHRGGPVTLVPVPGGKEEKGAFLGIFAIPFFFFFQSSLPNQYFIDEQSSCHNLLIFVD